MAAPVNGGEVYVPTKNFGRKVQSAEISFL